MGDHRVCKQLHCERLHFSDGPQQRIFHGSARRVEAVERQRERPRPIEALVRKKLVLRQRGRVGTHHDGWRGARVPAVAAGTSRDRQAVRKQVIVQRREQQRLQECAPRRWLGDAR